MKNSMKRSIGLLATTAALCWTCSVSAQSIGINYERLSSLEEPFAKDIAGWTATVTGLVDLAVAEDLRGDDDTDVGLIANGTVAIERQLRNRWTARIAYFAQYETDMDALVESSFEEVDAQYTDNLVGSVANPWGAIVVGNASGIVREETRRQRGVGNAALQFDASLAELEDWSAAYRGRYGPVVVTSVVDQDGNFDLGGTFQRPLGDKDYRFSARYTDGVYRSADGTTDFDTRGLGLIAELTYGSMIVDAGIGYDNLRANGINADRTYVSAGARTKWGAVSVSAEAHYGEIDGQRERSAAVGIAYDIARGLSANIGVNYVDSEVVIDGVQVTDSDSVNAIASARYSF